MTIVNLYRLPHADDLINCLHGAQYFTKMDLRTSYYHIRISKYHIPKIVFRTHYGHCEFLIMHLDWLMLPPYHISQMHFDMHNYMTQCLKCQINKAKRLKGVALLHPLDIPNKKSESISMAFVVNLPPIKRGHDAIWVVVDRLMKLARFIPIETR